MRCVSKYAFLWQFVGGFALGAVALVTLHPAASARSAPPVAVSARR